MAQTNPYGPLGQPYDTTAYRNASEHAILAVTLLLVFAVIALTAAATVCLSVVFVALFVALAYGATRAQHRALMAQATPITQNTAPALSEVVAGCVARLRPSQVQAFVVPSAVLNAYTFGITKPHVLVLHSSLLRVMDEDELRFVVGHELGHVRLGHTRLNSLIGGMAGIPSPFAASAVLALAFLWWNRACEVSSDRAGLLACGRLDKAVSALVKLAAGSDASSRDGLEQALRQIEAEDDTPLGALGEVLSTHPMMVRRIEELRRYAISDEYRRLQPLLARNEELSTFHVT
ncbi:MAG: M48 family metallopeptidase [Anaerolineales bacterium]|nr:M48 family metallopeptidase [Anaerolineales bacterium]